MALDSVVSRVWWSKSGTPAVTERLVTEGKPVQARAGHLRIDIQDSNHNSWRVDNVDLFELVDRI